MVLHDFLSSMGKLDILTHVGLDDYADKLNFLFSVWFLLIFCSITTVKTYFLNPISCYVPTIVGSHEGQIGYINNMCYTEGTYNVPPAEFKIDQKNPNWDEPYRDRRIYYYQWLPFLLGVQGIMFYTPRILWYMFANNRTGSDLSQLIKVAHEAQKAEGDKREKLVNHVCRQLELWLKNTRVISNSHYTSARESVYRRVQLLLPSKRLGTWLVLLYFFVKCLYIGNLVVQLLLMTKVLQADKLPEQRNSSIFTVAATFGAQLMADLISGKDWKNTGLFPRSGCCAVMLRQASDAQLMFTQCAIPVNMIHEKIFIFLWFWFVFVLALTLLSLVVWCVRMFSLNGRSRLIKKFLYLADVTSKKDSEEKVRIKDFMRKFLRHDGAFVMHMLALNCGDVVSTEICEELYKIYKEKHQLYDFRGFNDEARVVPTSNGQAVSPSNNVNNTNSLNRSACRRRKLSSSSEAKFNDSRRSQIEPSAPLDEQSEMKLVDDATSMA